MLAGKKILLGITGSIAAYKAILLVRLLVKAGAEVKVLMTPAAADFVSPLTLSTLSRTPVLTGLFAENSWANHVMLGRWADVMLIAPLSCNTLFKMAHGGCDNLLLATYLSATCPVVVAPAMDEDMWKHPATRANLEKLRSFGHFIIPVGTGELASGLVGDGRMAETEAIISYLDSTFFSSKDLEGKKALVTAGPTYEALDPVRYIGNHSSGKMGIAIASELAARGAAVTLVLGPAYLSHPLSPRITVKKVRSAAEMFAVCTEYFDQSDIAVMAAAVADYTPVNTAATKIKKQGEKLTIELTKTVDILKTLGQQKKPHQVLVGFALETDNEIENARKKLIEKNADFIILNSLNDEGAGFGYDTNKVTILEKGGQDSAFARKPKPEVAADIVDKIVKVLYA